MKRYVIGLDYGTDSARGLLVDAVDGASSLLPSRLIAGGAAASIATLRSRSSGSIPRTMPRLSTSCCARCAGSAPKHSPPWRPLPSTRHRAHRVLSTRGCVRWHFGRSSPTIPTLCSFCGKTIRPSVRRRGSMPHAASRRHAIRCSRADTTRRRVIGLRSYIY